jgi:hypothetical protein
VMRTRFGDHRNDQATQFIVGEVVSQCSCGS